MGLTLSQQRIEARSLHEVAEKNARQIPLGRVGDPEDIARVVRFLAGPESGWVTGQTFSADGGQDQCGADYES